MISLIWREKGKRRQGHLLRQIEEGMGGELNGSGEGLEPRSSRLEIQISMIWYAVFPHSLWWPDEGCGEGSGNRQSGTDRKKRSIGQW